VLEYIQGDQKVSVHLMTVL